MEVYEISTQVERLLRIKADKNNIPLGGSIELLPLCNMDCKMCYVRMTKEEMDAAGRMLTCDEWLRIAQEARDAGVLFLLLTGGEPLVYPEFRRLYTALTDMGFVVTINTNGTLIDEDWADFFAARPCRRMNITLYGKNDATYGELCRNPKGFSQVMRAAKLLKEREIPYRLTCSVTPYNVDELEALFYIAKELDVFLQPATYMFPAVRLGKDAAQQERLDPERAAQAMFLSHKLQRTEEEMAFSIRSTLANLFLPPRIANARGYTCHSGHSGFWMNWKGELLPCGMMNGPNTSLLEHSFRECWEYIVGDTAQVSYCFDCMQCRKQNICHVCPANLIAETGALDQRPDYICRFTNEMLRLMVETLSPEEQEKYFELVGA